MSSLLVSLALLLPEIFRPSIWTSSCLQQKQCLTAEKDEQTPGYPYPEDEKHEYQREDQRLTSHEGNSSKGLAMRGGSAAQMFLQAVLPVLTTSNVQLMH
ncbi:hypothetical protein [Pseudomonas sp. SJZ080]|uniref:hypothetical protein n=1 Tax=Pseudomonas sp. SJZ080 TaxID=2572888 RepID=UPI0015B40EAF|nr:hypothetical protein [Pseudomonas sp. SJZ080]